jgi:hypothetical protein
MKREVKKREGRKDKRGKIRVGGEERRGRRG